MSLTPDDVDKLVRLCRSQGVQRLEWEGLRLTLHESAFAATTRAAYPEATPSTAPVEEGEQPVPRRAGMAITLPADDALFDHVPRGGA